jgi:hypothetical protein
LNENHNVTNNCKNYDCDYDGFLDFLNAEAVNKEAALVTHPESESASETVRKEAVSNIDYDAESESASETVRKEAVSPPIDYNAFMDADPENVIDVDYDAFMVADPNPVNPNLPSIKLILDKRDKLDLEIGRRHKEICEMERALSQLKKKQDEARKSSRQFTKILGLKRKHKYQ